MPDYFLAFWNLENLFGPEDHPHRIDWIKDAVARDLRGWDAALYDRKLVQLARIITQMNGGAGPDILGVAEVEDGFVLADLVAKLAVGNPARDYRVIHVDSIRERRGVDTAFIYDRARFSVDSSLIFSHFVLRRTGTRDLLQATFRTTAGNDLILLCNHWPSRSGGTMESAGFRATAGETLGYWHERIRQETGSRAAVIAFGDFNDDPFDTSLRFNAVAWRERGDVARALSAKFLNLAWGYLHFRANDHRGDSRELDGTLYFGGNGNIFDQMLVSPPIVDGVGPFVLADGGARVEAFPDMVSHRVSEGPRRFGLPKGDAALNVDQDGYSDHFPVSLVIREI